MTASVSSEMAQIVGSSHPQHPSPAQVEAAVVSFAMLADATRVRMLWAMDSQELDVAGLAAVAGCRPTVASQHLSKLRFAGLGEGARGRPRIFFRLGGGAG